MLFAFFTDQPLKVMKRLGIAVPSTLSAAGSIRSNFHIADEGDQVRRGGGWWKPIFFCVGNTLVTELSWLTEVTCLLFLPWYMQ